VGLNNKQKNKIEGEEQKGGPRTPFVGSNKERREEGILQLAL